MNNEPDLKLRNEIIKLFNDKKFTILITRIYNEQKKFPNSIFFFSVLGNINNILNKFDEAVKNFNNILKSNKTKQSIIDFTETTIGHFMIQCIDMCEITSTYCPRHSLITLRNHYLPNIRYYIGQLKPLVDDAYFSHYVQDLQHILTRYVNNFRYDGDVIQIAREYISI